MTPVLLAVLWGSAAIAAGPAPFAAAGQLAPDHASPGLPSAPDALGPHGVWSGASVGSGKLREVVSLYLGDASGRSGGGTTFCSGTLVHPNWVLTAAHCVTDVQAYLDDGAHLWVGFGAAQPYDKKVEWYDWHAHPKYNVSGAAGSGYDIALIELVEPVNDEPTMPVNVSAVDTSWIGLDLTLVGYGVTNDGLNDSGTKRQESAPLIRYDLTGQGDLLYGYSGTVVYDRASGMYYQTADEPDSTANLCQGDSGGATLAEDSDGNYVLVAVSVIVTDGCARGGAGSTRTDLYSTWIRSYVDLATADQPSTSGGPTLPDYSVDDSPRGALVLPSRDAPITPDVGAAYPQRLACATGPGSSVGWLGIGLLGALAARRRRG